ncbi:hypothetical protein FG386_000623 [Cryptosporidium ryanae]|uniref:uncharacterized protein n=1 Tax=Cryptosporidium ryanae TaxID=515981 RepID=UPI00351AA0BD|nr:hypothetical protein FG386_000623 [Cryptosporidium ryanae]
MSSKARQATAIDAQTEKAFQKQETVFLGDKRLLSKKGSKIPRYFRDPGLGFSIPTEAKTGIYIDKKCPFTGNVSIRGRILKEDNSRQKKLFEIRGQIQ